MRNLRLSRRSLNTDKLLKFLRPILCLLLVAIIAPPAAAQDEWQRQGPFSIGNSMRAVHFVDSSVGFAVGDGGTIQKTIDGGANWTRIYSGTFADLNCVFFTDTQTGWIGCSDGAVLSTIDGGSTWHRSETCITSPIYGITATGMNTVEAVGAYGRRIYTTREAKHWFHRARASARVSLMDIDFGPQGLWMVDSNGGIYRANRDFLSKKATMPAGLRDIAFRQYVVSPGGNYSAVGYVCGQNGLIARTLDQGETWQILDTGCDSRLNQIQFICNDIICVVGDAGTILLSDDGGDTWRRQAVDCDANICGLHFPEPRSSSKAFGCAVGERGAVLVTNNGGKTWSSNLPAWVDTLYDVSYPGGNVCWAVKNGGVIAGTTDGGMSWSEQRLLSEGELFAVHAPGPMRIYTCGYGGTVFRSANGGRSWAAVTTSVNADLYDVAGFMGGPVIAVGARGTIVRSPGAGLKMTPVKSGTNAGLNCITMADSRNGWIAGDNRILLRTVDGGVNWTPLDISWGLDPLTSVDLLSVTSIGSTVLASGIIARTIPGSYLLDVPVLLYSTDSGVTWTILSELHTYDFSYPTLYSMQLLQDGRLMGVGLSAQIYVSTNLGRNWNRLLLAGGYELNGISINGATGYAVGDAGCIFKTTDGGVTWNKIRYKTEGDIGAAAFSDDLSGWIAGENGLVLYTGDGGSTWQAKDTGSTVHFVGADSTDPQRAWLMGERSVFATTDQGFTWLESKPAGTSNSLTCIDAFDNSTCWVGGRQGMVYRTADGGVSWTETNLGWWSYASVFGKLPTEKAWLGSPVRSLSFVSPTTGWAVGNESLIAKTVDAGANWIYQTDPSARTFYDMWTSVDAPFYREIVIGDSGLIRARGPLTGNVWWNTLESGVWDDLKDIDDNLIVGNNGVVLRSPDYGVTWHRICAPVLANLNAITRTVVGDVPVILVVGDGGTIIRSVDDGLTWSLLPFGLSEDLRGAAECTSPGRIWVCGTNGTALFTDDGGDTWVDQSYMGPNSVNFNCVAANQKTGQMLIASDIGLLTANTGGKPISGLVSKLNKLIVTVGSQDFAIFAVGESGVLYHYTSHYAKALRTATHADLKAVEYDPAKSRLAVLGSAGIAREYVYPVGLVAISNQELLSQWRSLGVWPRHDLTSVHFIDEMYGWAVGERGVIISTEDGGVNWVVQNSGTEADLEAVKFFDRTRGLAAGTYGVLLVTDDGGSTWHPADSTSAYSILGIAAGGSSAWLVGDNGTILKSEF